jgi:hypothetical protein
VPSSPRRTNGINDLLAGEQIDPLSRRLMDGVKFLSLLLLLVLANSFLNSGGEDRLEFNPVAAAAERTQSEPGARFSTKIVFSSDFEPPSVVTGQGEYDGETALARARLHLDTGEGTKVEVESLSDGSMVYIRSPQFPDKVPEGKEWLAIKCFVGQDTESAMPGEGPEGSLRMLEAAGDVQRVGSERVRGARTTRYRASVTMAGFAAQLRTEGNEDLAVHFEEFASEVPGSIRTEVWVDSKGVARRVHTVVTSLSEEGPVKMDLRMDLFDFGLQPDIQLPDSSKVFDMTPLLEERLDAPGEAS